MDEREFQLLIANTLHIPAPQIVDSCLALRHRIKDVFRLDEMMGDHQAVVVYKILDMDLTAVMGKLDFIEQEPSVQKRSSCKKQNLFNAVMFLLNQSEEEYNQRAMYRLLAAAQPPMPGSQTGALSDE